MSIQSEITRIQNGRDASFTAVENKGVTVPAGSTIDDLPDLIASISQGSGTPEIFWATYDVTTNADIDAAYQAGKVVCCLRNSRIYILAYCVSSTKHTFAATTPTQVWGLHCENDVWSTENRAIGAPSPNLPQPLGTAAIGTSLNFARADHVHAMPSTSDVGAAPAIAEVTVSTDGAVTQTLDAGKLYHFTGALTSLTITLNTAGIGVIPQYHFDFDCGSTAPTVTIPSTVILPANNTFDASKHYEVDILNNYGVVASWATS